MVGLLRILLCSISSVYRLLGGRSILHRLSILPALIRTRGREPPAEPAPGKKTQVKEVSSPQAEWQESAGSLLLLAAAHQTGLLTSLETALSPSLLTTGPSLRLTRSQPATLCRQVLTLLFLEAVGLRRTWDLRGYTGQALALLT